MECLWVDDEVPFLLSLFLFFSNVLYMINVNGPYVWSVFSVGTFRFIYAGTVDVNLDIAHDLLRAADQYLLEGLKHLCEYAISQVDQECFYFFCFSRFLLFNLIPWPWLIKLFFLGYFGGECFTNVRDVRGFQC